MPSNLFTARLMGYLVGLLPLVALLLLFRQAIPQTPGLILAAGGTFASIWVQQQARNKYPYDFKQRAEWLALLVYALVVIGIVLVFTQLWN
ncbi:MULTISPECIES: hypothetical protein [Hymenobacter]|uniref:Uncharacterized protein n=1 Tax=Hymenobacter jejuensis TaxID=2502781 RepID=A0A5B7ZVP0_9BACT|nr:MULTISPECIES: hypothetical protein [Hymenobacter]MBC6988819.1 hypothetical protein [Hymenobacter sp. BT491]QDA58869.1 hypothetical protein FHG12_01595 [Hymenobacter jejuensis]